MVDYIRKNPKNQTIVNTVKERNDEKLKPINQQMQKIAEEKKMKKKK